MPVADQVVSFFPCGVELSADFDRQQTPANLQPMPIPMIGRSFGYHELIKRDKVHLDIFWPKNTSQEDSDDLQTALEQFTAMRSG